jgi:hypothetical protein
MKTILDEFDGLRTCCGWRATGREIRVGSRAITNLTLPGFDGYWSLFSREQTIDTGERRADWIVGTRSAKASKSKPAYIPDDDGIRI